MPRTKVLTQEKHFKGNLPPREVDDLIQKLKFQYENYYTPRDIDGFIIIGGDGLSDAGWELVNAFKDWASKRGMSVYYHTSQEMVRMRNVLRNRTENIWDN